MKGYSAEKGTANLIRTKRGKTPGGRDYVAISRKKVNGSTTSTYTQVSGGKTEHVKNASYDSRLKNPLSTHKVELKKGEHFGEPIQKSFTKKSRKK
jgi:hypothetical protein